MASGYLKTVVQLGFLRKGNERKREERRGT